MNVNQAYISVLLKSVVLMLSSAVYAETIETQIIEENTVIEQFNQQGLNIWGLDKDELKQYKIEMQGNRKFWSPNLHPIIVLGTREGVTESERKRLAERMVVMERERLDREIAFEKAFQEANSRLYAGVPLFAESVDKEAKKSLLNQTGNYSYYIKLPCDACKPVIQNWLKNGSQLDLFIAANSDKDIRAFAQKMEISPLLVPGRVRLHRMSVAKMQSIGIRALPQAVINKSKVVKQ